MGLGVSCSSSSSCFGSSSGRSQLIIHPDNNSGGPVFCLQFYCWRAEPPLVTFWHHFRCGDDMAFILTAITASDACVRVCPVWTRMWMWMSFGAPNDGDDDDDDDDLLRPSECPPTVRECGCCVRDAFTSLTWMLQRIFGHPKHQHTRTGHRMHDKHTYTTHWGGPGHADAGQKKKQPGTETCCVVGSKTKKCPWHLIHAALMRTETEWSCSLAPNRHSGTKSADFRDITICF